MPPGPNPEPADKPAEVVTDKPAEVVTDKSLAADVAEEIGTIGTDSLSREELFKLYDQTLLEYRFQVQLNWDRAKHYLIFNASLITIVTGVLKLESSPHTLKTS